MALNASLSKFKSEISDAAARNAQYSRPTSSTPARTSTPKPGDAMKRTHDTAFSSTSTPAPASTAPAPGHAGSELLTQVWNSIKYLKEKSPAPVTFDNLISYLSLPIDAQKNIPLIKRALQGHERVTYIPKTASARESLKYRPLYPITNAEELKDYLATTHSASGIKVSDLKDGWADCLPALDKLETQGFVLLTRRKKDNTPVTIYADSPTYHVLNPVSGQPQRASADFAEVWAKIKLPGSEVELRNELEKASLTPTSQVKEIRRGPVEKKKEKRRVNRKGGKTTNAHVLHLLKDYSRK